MRTDKNIVLLLISSLHPASAFLLNAPKTLLLPSISLESSVRTYDTYTNDNLSQRISRPGDPSYAQSLEDRLASIESGRRSPSFQARGSEYYAPNLADQIFSNRVPIKVQGGSLKTWTYNSAAVEAVHVGMKTEGRPLDADIELWQGPDNTPCKLRVYVEDGAERPFSCMIATPRGPNTIALRNIGHLEFPLDATVVADTPDIIAPSTSMREFSGEPLIIQGGALRTYPFEPSVQSVQVLLNTDGRPLNARIELLQGPNNIKQVVELYTEDGLDRPFMMVIETPGSGNVVRVVNTATVEFPLTAGVEAYSIDSEYSDIEPVLGGDTNDGFMTSRRSFF
jgi:hypothetical protein